MNFSKWLMTEARHNSTGTLRYGENNRVTLEIDPELVRYLLTMMPKYVEVQPQMYRPHITVVRTRIESVDPDHPAWGKHEGKKIPFEYDPHIYYQEPYYFLKAYSKELEDIREELGLPRMRPGFKNFHFTIGNTKGNQNNKS